MVNIQNTVFTVVASAAVAQACWNPIKTIGKLLKVRGTNNMFEERDLIERGKLPSRDPSLGAALTNIPRDRLLGPL